MTETVLGIIGGSGFYNLPGLENSRWQAVASPWGAPSDEILFADIAGLPIRFLPRHGRGHKIPPSEINYRANIDAMKRAGVTDLVSISACGSFKEHLAPGVFVLVDQFVDRTFERAKASLERAGSRMSRSPIRSRRCSSTNLNGPSRPRASSTSAAAPTS